MIVFFIFISIIILTTLGYGLFLKKILLKLNYVNSLGLGETGLIGFYTLLIISLLIHFFVPLSDTVNVTIIFVGILSFFLFYKVLELHLKLRVTIIIFTLGLPALFSIKGHPDFEWYYLPYINYLKDFKIIFGIANINDFIGYSHTWNDIAAIFRVPIVNIKGLNLVPAVFAFFVIISIFEIINKNKNNELIKIFSYFILIFIIAKYSKVNEYGSHATPALLSFIVIIYFLALIFNQNQKKKEILFKILLFTSFVCILRLNYVILFPIILFILVKYYNDLIFIFFKKKFFSFLLLLAFIYLIKNFIVTGCLLYPVPWTCFSKNLVIWSVSSEYAQQRYDFVSATARGWQNHVVIDGGVDDRVEYYKVVDESKIYSPSTYLDKGLKFWLKFWLKSGDFIKNLNNIIIVSFIFLTTFLFSKKSLLYSEFKKNLSYFYASFLVLLLIVILWFLLTPQTIYGGNVVIVSFFSFLFSFFIIHLKFDKNKLNYSFIFLFLISITYFEVKNIKRVYEEYFITPDKIKTFPWIEIRNYDLNKDYIKSMVDGIEINIKLNEKNERTGMATRCGNIDMLCLPEERIVCLEEIRKNKNYLMIVGNTIKCNDHLKSRLWY